MGHKFQQRRAGEQLITITTTSTLTFPFCSFLLPPIRPTHTKPATATHTCYNNNFYLNKQGLNNLLNEPETEKECANYFKNVYFFKQTKTHISNYQSCQEEKNLHQCPQEGKIF